MVHKCAARQNNQGLFLADQQLQGETASFTRQNAAGTVYGFECQEERDYYPYWHPTPWKDIAIFTSNTSDCDFYKAQSSNVLAKGLCSVPQYNNAENCTENGGNWQTYYHDITAPDCLPAPFSRDNHLGITADGYHMNYRWVIPSFSKAINCVLRIRYNISTADYYGGPQASFIDSNYNDPNGNPNVLEPVPGGISPIYDDPIVDFGVTTAIELNINTNQYGRTFQDRSHMFIILASAPSSPSCNNIYNMNVRGKRGNIVEVFPAVEYDFVPGSSEFTLNISTGDCVHIQWTGSNANPAGNEGQGTASTDRSNLVQMEALDLNYPMNLTDATMFDGLPSSSQLTAAIGFATSGILNGAVDPELDTSSPYYNGPLVPFNNKGCYYFMCTRNNAFSNRSQKGTINVN